MDVFITKWATDCYRDLIVSKKIISKELFSEIIRPDVELIKAENEMPFNSDKFEVNKFWGPAKSRGIRIPNGHKMKWHNLGDGKIQLRLCLLILAGDCFVCKAYVKNEKSEKREMALFKAHTIMIEHGHYEVKGRL